MPKADAVAFLRSVSVFKDLAEPHLVALALRLQPRRLTKGEVLFREGDKGEELYLIREGTVVVSKPVIGRVEQVLARMGPGEFFGEMSLFDRAPRSATIQAETDALLLCLDRESLQQLVEISPRAAAAFFFQMVQVFVSRLRESGNLVAEVTRWGLEATGLDLDSKFPG
ncbi:MAG: cyclic nucleotide-binding domain-containing protein [Candidatus Rokubacteria bacterium]|nr:cyclic nucleotide-binding domain-containing protein [Candidatus Rokubacteria bacterium]